jgi:hypothetical protein
LQKAKRKYPGPSHALATKQIRALKPVIWYFLDLQFLLREPHRHFPSRQNVLKLGGVLPMPTNTLPVEDKKNREDLPVKR